MPPSRSVSSPEVKCWGKVRLEAQLPLGWCPQHGALSFLRQLQKVSSLLTPRSRCKAKCRRIRWAARGSGWALRPREGLSRVSVALSRCLGESRWPGWCSLERAALAVPWQFSPPTAARQRQGFLGPAPSQAAAHAPDSNLDSRGGDMSPLLCFPFLQAVTSGRGNNTLNCSCSISCTIPSSTWRADPIPSLPRVENRLLLPSSPLFVRHCSLGFWLQCFRLYLGTGEHRACLLPVSFVCSFPFYMCLGRRAGCLLLTTQLASTLLAVAVTARCSRLVRAPWVIPTAKESNTALKPPLGGER